MIIKDTVSDNFFDKMDNQKEIPNFFNFNNNEHFQKEFIEIFQKNFLDNENNLKKLLYLFQFQVNPLMIVSSRSKYLYRNKILLFINYICNFYI